MCVGSVWKSWSLIKPGFMRQIRENPVPTLQEASLIALKTNVAKGAAYIAAKAAGHSMPRDHTQNYRVFFHFDLKEEGDAWYFWHLHSYQCILLTAFYLYTVCIFFNWSHIIISNPEHYSNTYYTYIYFIFLM